MRRYSREELQSQVLRFATDFFLLHRDLRDAEHLTSCMDRVSLVEPSRPATLAPQQQALRVRPPGRSQDETGSRRQSRHYQGRRAWFYKMTQDLLSRASAPASHFSLNLHEPVKKLLDRYGAKKSSSKRRHHSCHFRTDRAARTRGPSQSLRARPSDSERLQLLQRQRASSDLPALELGLGVAHQGDSPTTGPMAVARHDFKGAQSFRPLVRLRKTRCRMLDRQKSHFGLFQFLQRCRAHPPKSSMNSRSLHRDGSS